MSSKNLQLFPYSSPIYKNRSPNISSPDNNYQTVASPIKYLLQSKLNMGKEGHRGEQEVELISGLLAECTIFKDLGISLQDINIHRQLCQGVVLIFCQNPHIMDIKDNQLYIFFQGQGFQYMQNSFEKEVAKKYKIYENNEYIMVRKICTNDYFLSQEYNLRYQVNHRKYQLMVDQNTLLGKISDELFNKIFLPKIVERQKQLVGFMKKVVIFNGLSQSFFMELMKFLIDDKAKAEEKVITRGEKSKYVYFIKSGEMEIRRFESRAKSGNKGVQYYILNSKPYTSQKLLPFQTFGMDQLDMLEPNVDKQVACLTDCQFYKIEKRLLAIIITSFELQFHQKNKIWSEVNINSQIKGQNYCTPQQQLLLRNAERIRSSQRKTRDLKLKYFALKKPKKEVQNEEKVSPQKNGREAMDEQLETLQNSRVASPQEKRRMIKTTDGRFRSIKTNIRKYLNNVGVKVEENRSQILRKTLEGSKQLGQNEDNQVNNYEFASFEDEVRRSSLQLRHSNAFDYKEQMQPVKLTRSMSSSANLNGSNKFVPKIQAKMKSSSINSTRYSSDLIGMYLDRKIKNEIVKKAEKVLNLSKNLKLIENNSIKRLFAVRDCKVINAMSEQDKKTIADDIVERMSNLRDNPLLLQIQNQRRKIERQLKLADRRAKIPEDSPRKYKKEDEFIIIKNNQES